MSGTRVLPMLMMVAYATFLFPFPFLLPVTLAMLASLAWEPAGIVVAFLWTLLAVIGALHDALGTKP